jgi:hypothetical protein
MRRTTIVLFGCVIVAVLALGIGYVLGGSWIGAAAAVGIGGAWLLVHLLSDRPAGNLLAWLCLTSVAAIGVAIGLPAGFMLVAAVAALCAWDIAHYEQRRDEVSRVDSSDAMERQHLIRLAITAAGGLALGAAALLVRVNFGFGVAIVLAIVAVVLLSQLARMATRG